MKKLIVLCTIVLTVLILISGCPQPPEVVEPGPKPTVGIYTPSDTVEAGKGFLVFGSTKPGQKVWAEVKFGEKIERGEGIINQDIRDYAEADENGFFYLGVTVPKDVAPGDYEVEIYLGEDFDSRHLFTKRSIHVKAGEE